VEIPAPEEPSTESPDPADSVSPEIGDPEDSEDAPDPED
jgi:hypothetical protein